MTDAWIRESANTATGGALSDRQSRLAAEGTYRKRMENMLHEDNCFEVTMVGKVLVGYLTTFIKNLLL